MECLKISHVEYSLIQEGDYPYSLCEDFITAETELVSVWSIMQTKKKRIMYRCISIILIAVKL